jgi:hypothetical protein
MTHREIPEGSIEIQTGLYAYRHNYTVGGAPRSRYILYSADGYCFYWLSNPENYDEEGNLKPVNERVYATYMSCAIRDTLETINADIVSVPVEDSYEIVSRSSNPPVTA